MHIKMICSATRVELSTQWSYWLFNWRSKYIWKKSQLIAHISLSVLMNETPRNLTYKMSLTFIFMIVSNVQATSLSITASTSHSLFSYTAQWTFSEESKLWTHNFQLNSYHTFCLSLIQRLNNQVTDWVVQLEYNLCIIFARHFASEKLCEVLLIIKYLKVT